ncbi:uncharacterized protein LOC123293887 [Chrysoperla carnea]|uniref:uncharacterized protein LOC123293887 n=1 Tax=Chrysoperla carnea TaxID=189513 RepID=UPI001D08923D|nr:uncharacterized protein LOC123293887 [Chrysoperla carnea]
MSGTISSESADDVEKILRRIIIKENLSVKLFQEQLFKCIPDTILSKKTSRNLIIYVLDKHEIKPTKCKLLLQYIIGLLEYNLINYDAIDTFYYNYYKLLSTSGSLLVPLVCQLIYMLTKDPNDLLRLLVLRIKEGFKTNAVPKSLTCLLTLIKSLRPDLVPERIPAYSIEHAFRLLPINFRNDLEKVKPSHTLSENVSVDIQWRLANANKKDLIKLIPDLSLVNVGSLYDTNFAEKTLIEYDNLIELHSEKCSAKNVANSMALLNNFAGVHFLTHEYDTVLKKRLIYSLQQQLRYEISQFTPTSIKNLKELFKSINNLYDCAQQAIN